MSLSRAVLVPILLACIAVCGLQTGCGKKNRDAKKNAAMPKPPPPEETAAKIEAMPNSDIALGNTYREQPVRVEVLKGWKVRYTAVSVDDPAKVTWFNGDTQFGMGSPLEREELTVGDFFITMKATKNGKAVEA